MIQLAITYTSVYKLFYFCADFVYVLLFPQLAAAIFSPRMVNPIGSISAFIFGLILRLCAGEEVLNVPVVSFHQILTVILNPTLSENLTLALITSCLNP